MAQLSILNDRSKSITRLTRNSKIFKSIIKSIQDKKGEKIVSLDLRKIPEAVADFFIICSATSSTQIKAIADFIDYQLFEECGEKPYRHEGQHSAHWILIDYVNIVVHVMHPESRQFYGLEEMWSDAPTQTHEEEIPQQQNNL